MVTKYTVTYSDGATADFLTLEDLIAHDQEGVSVAADAGLTDAGLVEAPAAGAVTTEASAPAEELSMGETPAQTPSASEVSAEVEKLASEVPDATA